MRCGSSLTITITVTAVTRLASLASVSVATSGGENRQQTGETIINVVKSVSVLTLTADIEDVNLIDNVWHQL